MNGRKNAKAGISWHDTGKEDLARAYRRVLAALRDPETGAFLDRHLERHDCPVCTAADPETLFVKDGIPYVRCRSCGMFFQNPSLNGAALGAIYSDPEVGRIFNDRVLQHGAQRAFDGEKFQATLDRVAPELEMGAKVLDVGCAAGHFLELCRERGFHTKGVELSEYSVRHCRDRLGLDVDRADWKDYDVAGGGLDLVSFWSSLSYMDAPLEALRKAHFALRPNGMLVVLSDGNPHSLVMRVLRERCVGFEAPRKWYFTPTVLQRALRQTGFAVVEVRSLIHGLDTVQAHLDYGDAYGGAPREALFDAEEKLAVQAWMERNVMGYKFQIVARKEE